MRLITKIAAAAFAAIMLVPAGAQAQKKDGDKIGIVAHRGFWNCEEAGYAQNSIAALKCAQEAGVWGSEFDVYLTSDNRLVVNHDSHVQGMEIEATPYDKVREINLPNGEVIPSIEEYLEQGKKCKSTVLVFEVKSHNLSDERQDIIADLAVQKVKEFKLSPERVIFIAFSYRICKRIAEQMPDYTVQYLSSDKKPAEVYADGINGIDYHGNAFVENPSWVSEAKELGMSTNVWTINKAEDMPYFFKLGVDQLSTDNPLLARELLQKNGYVENRAKKVKIKK